MWKHHKGISYMPWVKCTGLPMLANVVCKNTVKHHTLYKPITVELGQPRWRSTGWAGFCFSPAITHLIQLNNQVCYCWVGIEVCSPSRSGISGARLATAGLQFILFTCNGALVTYLLLLNYLLLLRLRCLIFTYELAYLYLLWILWSEGI